MIEAVIFDYNRTLVQGEELPPKFYPDTLSVLGILKRRGIKMAVVSVGADPAKRLKEFEDLRLREHGIGIFKIVGPDDRKDLQSVLDELEVKATLCLVVGDRIKKEIVEGNKVGAITVWLQQGKFASEKPETFEEEPNYTINSLAELTQIIDTIT